MHHKMKFGLGSIAKGPAVWQNCLYRSGIAHEIEGAPRAVIPFRQVYLACDGAAIFVVIIVGKRNIRIFVLLLIVITQSVFLPLS